MGILITLSIAIDFLGWLKDRKRKAHVSARLNVLLVEDDSIDVEALARSLRQQPAASLSLIVVNDGQAALDLLRQHYERLYPYIILLDLGLPGMDGTTFLRELRCDALLRDSVIFVLTVSLDEADITDVYQLGVAGYIPKRTVGIDMQALTTFLIAYATAVQFPHKLS